MRKQHFIGNAWCEPSTGDYLPIIDPSNGDVVGDIARGTAADIDAAVAAARQAVGDTFDGPWGVLSASERGRLLYSLASAVQARVEEFALLEAQDTGKSIKTARTDAIFLARYLEFYAGACDKLHGDTIPFQTGFT
ncbi:MAG: aldehyde dehydrogenase family protein, partial [Limnohabitans sp.]|nr:aldehyde dehydrogenase family protein [Limnohabitans sp.]